MQDGYALCSNKWALDKNIKNELGLLIIISSLTAEKGYCYASNEYLAEVFNSSEPVISRKIKKLEQKGYIKIAYKKRGCEVISREIRLTKLLIDDYQKSQSTINKKVKENNISINNKRKIYKKKVIPDWFDKDISSTETIDTGFETFIKEFRNVVKQ